MSSRYLLPCSCGKTIPVQPAQAGDTVRCACGQSLVVPSMRGIRKLEPVTDAPERASRQRTWSPTKGVLFAVGALMLLAGGATAGFNYLRYVQISEIQPSDEHMQQTLNMIDESTPEELLDMWHMASEQGLGEYGSSIFIGARNAAHYFRTLLIVGSVTAAVGLALVFLAVLLPGSSRPR